MNKEVKRLKNILYLKFVRNIVLFSIPFILAAIWMTYNYEIVLTAGVVSAISATFFFLQSKKYISYIETFNDNICRIDLETIWLKSTFVKIEGAPKFLVFSKCIIVPKGIEFELYYNARKTQGKMDKIAFDADRVVLERDYTKHRSVYKYVIQ